MKIKFKARRAPRSTRLRMKWVRRLFEARRLAPSSGRGAPKPAHVRRDARREETKRETTASAGRAPRRGQGRQAGSLQLRMSGVAKGAATILDRKPSSPSSASASTASAKRRRAGALACAPNSREGIRSARLDRSAPSCPPPVAPRIRPSADREANLPAIWPSDAPAWATPHQVAMASGRPAPRNRAAHPLRRPGYRNRRRI